MVSNLIFVAFIASLSTCHGFWDMLLPAIRTKSPEYIGRILNEMTPIVTTTPKLQILASYDYVVVGSGASGGALASRLSEDPNVTVLLLEVGKPETVAESVPLFTPMNQWSHHNWRHKQEAQPNCCRAMTQNRCHHPRGKAVGGTSAINYMIYSRGNAVDYDRLGAINPGWSYEDVLPLFMKTEKVQMEMGTFDAGFHGTNGSLTTEHLYRNEATEAFLKGGQEMGYNITDYNGKNQTGFSFIQGTLNKGRRCSVTISYIKDALKRPNFHLLSEALVTKVLIKDLVAAGVNYRYKKLNYTVAAKKEVILSAGTFNTPHILMLSGIGPKSQLDKFGIPIIKELPVGRNMHDHIGYVGITFLMEKELINFFDFLDVKHIVNWAVFGKGFLTSLGGVDGIAFFKTNASQETIELPDMELIFYGAGHVASDFGFINKNIFDITDYYYDAMFKPLEGKPGFTIVPMMLHPKSRGSVELMSDRPEDLVRVYGNFFAEEQDVLTMVEAIKFILRLGETEAFKQIGAKLALTIIPDCKPLGYPSDEYWKCAVQFLTTTIHHQSGTCKMGPKTDPTSVIDNELKVIGIKSLRVADTSILPSAISAHYNALAYMIGEKAAQLIKK